MNKTIKIEHTGEGGPVSVGSDEKEPAWKAAEILARRMYGPRGIVGAMRLDSRAPDGSSATYEAFLGVCPTKAEQRRGANGVTGRNVWIYV